MAVGQGSCVSGVEPALGGSENTEPGQRTSRSARQSRVSPARGGDNEQAGVSGVWQVEEDGVDEAGVVASGQMAPKALWARVRRWNGVLSLFSH